MNTLLLEVDDEGIATCTFNRPEVRNALSVEMVRELDAVLEELAARDDLRALIFTGAGGKAFVSGADIAELRQRQRADAMRFINNGLLRRIERFGMPTIAAINGYALGGGCELAMACDLRVCGAGAKLGQPEVSLGIIPGAGATYRLTRLVGTGIARELIFTGRIIDAAEALRIGLVNRVVADADLMHSARQLAGEIAANSAWAVRYAKLGLLHVDEMSTDAAMALEATAQAVLFEDADKNMRMDAFLARRKAPRK